MSAPASALSTHAFARSFGGPGAGAGQLQLRPASEGVAGSGVAVNATTHDIYVADTGNHRIEEFNREGEFVLTFGKDVNKTKLAGGLASEAEEDVCTAAEVGLGAECQAGSEGSEPDQLGAPVFVAVDNATGGEGDVYVGDSADALITKFTSAGALVGSWGNNGSGGAPNGQLKGSETRAFHELMGLTVDSSGSLDVLVDKEEPHSIMQFARDGSFHEEFEVARQNSPDGLALDGTGQFFKANGTPSVEELSGSGAKIGQLTKSEAATGVAAAGGDVYVDDGGLVEHFSLTAPEVVSEPGGGSCTVEEQGAGCPPSDSFGDQGELSGAAGIGVDPSDGEVFVANTSTNQLVAFTPASLPEATTEAATEVQPTAATLNGTVDPEGLTLKPGVEGCRFEYGETTAYGHVAPCEPETPTGSSPVPVKAVASGLQPDTVYHFRVTGADGEGARHGNDAVFETTGPPTITEVKAKEVTRISAGIHAQVHPHGFATHYLVEYGTTSSFGSSTPPVELESPTENAEVTIPVTGLTLGTTYHYRVVATNEAGGKPNVTDSPEELFTTLSAAPVENEAAEDVGSTEATVTASINALSELTTYRVEYGTTEAYGQQTPEGTVGKPSGSVNVSGQLTHLTPATTYHFRFVAHNGAGTTSGPDTTFTTTTTSPASSLALPDARTFELVSDPSVPGEVYVPGGSVTQPPIEVVPTSHVFRASASGESVAYVGEAGTVGGNGLTGTGLGNEWVATRNAHIASWERAVITPQVAGPGEGETNAVYESFSENLTAGFFSTITTPRFSAGANPAGPGEECGALFAHSASGIGALFSEKLGAGRQACGPTQGENGHYTAQSLLFAGANSGTAAVPADTQLLLQTPAPLTPGDDEAPEKEEGNNLYLSTAGHVRPIGVLPNGEHDDDAVFGGTSGEPLTVAKSVPGDLSNAISADGSKIFWTALEPAEENKERVAEHLHALYVREAATTPAARTVQLDASQSPAGSGVKEQQERAQRSGGGRFWTATPDGSKVFFSDCSRLTEDSTAQNGQGCFHTSNGGLVSTGNDLYEYDFTKPTGERLIDLTVDHHVEDSLGADVQGVIGTSEDGACAYFVANGVLAGPNGEGARPTSGQPNLYLLHGGNTTFVAQLAEGDDQTGIPLLGNANAVMGDWRPDLGYRTASVSVEGCHVVFQSKRRLTNFDNKGVREVYVYGAETGQLTCASCVGVPTPDPQGSYLTASLNPTYMLRSISSDGSRVFFNSDEPLVPQDTNGVQDVYEWERGGEGSCTSPSGCLFLLSGGTSTTRSYFLDADADGDNVFFTHRGILNGLGGDGKSNVVLDARVGGGFPAQPSRECTSCRPAPTPPPSFTGPPSVTFSGGGNFAPPPPSHKAKTAAEVRAEQLAKALKVCRAQHNRNKRLACEKYARKRFGPPQKARHPAKRASRNLGAKA